jgi:hypothetical protein
MSLVDRYVTEVGKNLPRKTRSDIEAEIHSLIDDMLEDRSKNEGRTQDEDMIVEVLKELGSPEKMAASYQGEKYLIGPRLYPTFILVLKIVATILVVLASVQFGMGVAQPGMTPNGFLTLVTTSFGQLLNSLMVALGNIVLIFAIIQWTVPDMKVEVKEWDPLSLKETPSSDEIKPAALIWDIAFTIFAILLFNFHPDWIGAGFMKGGTWYFFPVLSLEFYRYLPWWNLIWLASIGLDIILLRQKRWQSATHWFKAGIRLVTMIILYNMLVGPSIVNLTPESLAVFTQIGPGSAGLAGLAPLVNFSVDILLVLLMVLEGVELAKSLYRLLFKRTQPAVMKSGS